ncbi:hypothetical protein BU15DRAFT_76107 [Melanogaster broomeanus]|nr:hypothetical protein BU15DRAFT_76107 [Melanogaster broomeanus]
MVDAFRQRLCNQPHPPSFLPPKPAIIKRPRRNIAVSSRERKGAGSQIPPLAAGFFHKQSCTPPQESGCSTCLNLGKCQEILEDIHHIEPSNYLLYEGVSIVDYAHILSIMGDDDSYKPKIRYFPSKQKLTVTMPSEAHQVLINPISSTIKAAIDTIEYDDAILVRLEQSTAFAGTTHFPSTPDLQMLIDTVSPNPDIAQNRTLWVMEVTFSQTDDDVTEQLRSFIAKSSDLIVVSKLLVKESRTFHAPGKKSQFSRNAKRSKMLSNSQVLSQRDKSNPYGPVVVEGHTWISIGYVEFQVWVRKPGNLSIDLEDLDPEGYAHWRLYPSEGDDVGDVNEMFRSGLKQVKDAILYRMTHLHDAVSATDSDIEQALQCIQEWTPPKIVLSKEFGRQAFNATRSGMIPSLWEDPVNPVDQLRAKRGKGHKEYFPL